MKTPLIFEHWITKTERTPENILRAYYDSDLTLEDLEAIQLRHPTPELEKVIAIIQTDEDLWE